MTAESANCSRRVPGMMTVLLGQVTEKFREAVKAQAEREQIPVYQFQHKERKDDVANNCANGAPTRHRASWAPAPPDMSNAQRRGDHDHPVAVGVGGVLGL